jgi:hypothetical protein
MWKSIFQNKLINHLQSKFTIIRPKNYKKMYTKRVMYLLMVIALLPKASMNTQ